MSHLFFEWLYWAVFLYAWNIDCMILLGRGGFSKVELHTVGGIDYARKVIPLNTPSCYREVSITKHLQGAVGVVKLISVDEDEHNVYLVLERCHVRRCPSSRDTMVERKVYIRDTLKAIKSVHDRGIVHGDVKPDNLMTSPAGVVNVIDFGASIYAGSSETVKQCTPVFCSPERLTSSVCNTTDVWAAGVMAFHALTDVYPFYGADMYVIFKKILEKDVDLASVEQVGGRCAADFVGRMLDKDPSTRMCAGEALEHPWLCL